MNSVSISKGSLGASAPISLVGLNKTGEFTPISVLATISAGAALTYNIEVTNDNVEVFDYSPAAGNWNVVDNANALTASANFTLQAQVRAIRINITSYTSGTVNLAAASS